MRAQRIVLNPTFAGGLVRAGVGPQPTRGRGEERTAAAPAPPQGGLTPREREVAVLVARGRTNPQSARALVIAPRTAMRHVEHAMAKLGVHSRAEVGAWAAQQGLLGAGGA